MQDVELREIFPRQWQIKRQESVHPMDGGYHSCRVYSHVTINFYFFFKKKSRQAKKCSIGDRNVAYCLSIRMSTMRRKTTPKIIAGIVL